MQCNPLAGDHCNRFRETSFALSALRLLPEILVRALKNICYICFCLSLLPVGVHSPEAGVPAGPQSL